VKRLRLANDKNALSGDIHSAGDIRNHCTVLAQLCNITNTTNEVLIEFFISDLNSNHLAALCTHRKRCRAHSFRLLCDTYLRKDVKEEFLSCTALETTTKNQDVMDSISLLIETAGNRSKPGF